MNIKCLNVKCLNVFRKCRKWSESDIFHIFNKNNMLLLLAAAVVGTAAVENDMLHLVGDNRNTHCLFDSRGGKRAKWLKN